MRIRVEQVSITPPIARVQALRRTEEEGTSARDVDEERIEEAHDRYVRYGLGDRDDAAAMEYLVPGRRFDPKRPCLVRDFTRPG